MPHASFDGLRVLSLESRRAREVEKLVRTYNGESYNVPSMREVPLESNTPCLEFGQGLLEGKFDLVVFLTGGPAEETVDKLPGFSESITEYRDQNGELVITARGVGVRTERPVDQK